MNGDENLFKTKKKKKKFKIKYEKIANNILFVEIYQKPTKC